ncbi:hypothetical protein QBC41DRAFT_50238 [Cercophora samala]|uniref:C2H2-type domain-containing protein n=1 Tax=Cercophora samala TaxID=330535 RepID=A0AA39YVR2_9PEZI|nr:hypothetical protein QBC41DRAFT_50238 [Cercophora samala]
MACDMLHLFDHEQACSDDSLACALLREKLRELITGLEKQSLSGCPLDDIGRFLVNILRLASELARSVIKGHHIREFTTGLAPFLAREPGLRSTKYLDGKHEALKSASCPQFPYQRYSALYHYERTCSFTHKFVFRRKISGQLRELSKTALDIWTNSPTIPSSLRAYLHPPLPTSACTDPGSEPPPPQSTSLPFRDSPSVPVGPTFTDPPMATTYGPASWDMPSVESTTMDHASSTGNDDYYDDNMEHAVVTSLEELSSRGRGVGPYICSYGGSCNKGGVDSHGRMRIFKRNSDIKAHLEKHEKRYKCDMPGCPKPEKGFARLDQLERHKQNVSHGSHRGR